MSSRPLIMLIDGHALAFRAFHALANAGLRSSHGEPTYAVYGFAAILLNAIHEHQPTYLAVSFDVGRTFRDELFADYKAGRAATPAEFEPQLRRINQFLEAMNVPIITAAGYEADDVIGTLARLASERGLDSLILTGDTDTLQLVDERVRVLLANPFGQRMAAKIYGVAEVIERYKGLQPAQLADLRGLKGDASDNIPGVRGIGEAGAIALLNQFGDIDTLFDRLDEVPARYRKHLAGQREAAEFSRRLATIVRDVPVTLDLAHATLSQYDRATVVALFQELEIGMNLLRRLPAPEGQAVAAALPAHGASAMQPALFADATPAEPVPRHAGDYRAVCDDATLASLIGEIRDAGQLAFDTETTGLNPLVSGLVGIALAARPGAAWYIPIGHQVGTQLPRGQVLDALRPLFVDPAIRRYAHHAKFDIEVLEQAGVPVGALAGDTMLAAALLDKRRGLKELAFMELRLDEPPQPIEALIGKGRQQISFAAVPIEQATPYAASDADLTLRLAATLLPQLEHAGATATVYRELELPLVPVLVRMEQAGIALDVPYMQALGARLGQRLTQLTTEIHALARQPFNINSGDQLADVLFGTIGLPAVGLERTSTGRISLTAAVLEQLRGDDTSGIVEAILAYRLLSKLKSTYVDSLPALVNPATGRVHTSYAQLGAATGRLASQDPNLQNIPARTEEGREVRRGFVATPGHQLLAADYSQIELRVLAHLTDDANLVRAFQEGQDIHAATAAQLFGVAEPQVSREQRRVAKTVVFGVIYGISAFGLAPRIGASRGEAQALIDGFFARFPAVRAYIDRTLEQGRREGAVASLFGRRRAMPELLAGGARARAAEREAINHPIQATAADVMKLAMIRVDAALRDAASPARLLLQVHDELILEVPDAHLRATAELVRHAMESAYTFEHVPLRVELETGPNWDELSALA